MTKKQPLTVDRFESFFELLPSRADSDRAWTLSRDEIEARNFDLKAVNPNAKSTEDTRTPEELLDIVEAKGREVDAVIKELRRLPDAESRRQELRRAIARVISQRVEREARDRPLHLLVRMDGEDVPRRILEPGDGGALAAPRDPLGFGGGRGARLGR